MSNITNIRDTAVRDDASLGGQVLAEAAPLYYRFGVASNLRRRVITALPPIKTAPIEILGPARA